MISGITTGVGFLIMTSAIDGITGMNPTQVTLFYEKFYILAFDWSNLTNSYAVTIGLTTLAAGWIAQRFSHRYFIFIAILVGYCCSMLMHGIVPQVVTEVELLGRIPFDLLPMSMPPLNYEHLVVGLDLVDSAVTIALIGLAQSMVIAKGIKLKTNQHIDSDKEVFAQGLITYK